LKFEGRDLLAANVRDTPKLQNSHWSWKTRF